MVRLSKALPRPELRALAEDTRAKLDEFKEYVPIIMAVCNPGGWRASSKGCGQHPDGDSSDCASAAVQFGSTSCVSAGGQRSRP